MVGFIIILPTSPNVAELLSPVQVVPPFVVLKSPAPPTAPKFPNGSPVPTYKVFLSCGLITIVDVAKFGISLSVRFFHVIPSSSVNQTPPLTVPANQRLLFVGSIAIPLVLPGTLAGPLSTKTGFKDFALLKRFLVSTAFLNSSSKYPFL